MTWEEPGSEATSRFDLKMGVHPRTSLHQHSKKCMHLYKSHVMLIVKSVHEIIQLMDRIVAL